jgi:hypothetical protein
MIDATLAAFLQSGIAIQIGTRNATLEPSGARAIAVRVDESGTYFEVFLAEAASPFILPNLDDNGQAAVVFVRPTDERACQIKGVFAGVRPASEAERPIVLGQWDGFMAELGRIGVPRSVFAHWITWPAIAIRLRATAIFDQTPGPNAGAVLA